jgi:hypothetical protein
MCGFIDPGLRRDDDHVSACAQFDYIRFRGHDEILGARADFPVISRIGP